MPAAIDLKPFGFTPTESLAYNALIERGPLGGYTLAKVLSIARANAYQALHGLEAKGAAEGTQDVPRRFRPLQPEVLLAAVVDREARKIDTLELAVRSAPAGGGRQTAAPIGSLRSLEDLILRTAARTMETVECLGPAQMIERLAPVWHKRVADGSPTRLWIAGTGGDRLPIQVSGRVQFPEDDVVGASAILVLAGSVAIAGVIHPTEAHGFWTNDPLQVWLARLALRHLTS